MRVLILLCLFMLSGVAQAQATSPPPINDAGALALKKDVEDVLLWRTQISKATGEGMLIGGDITATPKGSFYEVKIPNVSLVSQRGHTMNIGTLTMNAAPGAVGEWLISMAIPSPLKVVDAAGKPVADITIARQKFSAAWLPAAGFMHKMDAEYGGLTIKGSNDAPYTATIASMKNVMNLKKNADGTWSGPSRFTASDISMDITGKDTAKIKIASVAGSGHYDRLDTASQKALQDKLRTIVKPEQKDLSPEQKRQLTDLMLKNMKGMMNGVTGGLDVINVSADITAAPKTPEAKAETISIRLVKFFANGSATNLLADKSDLGFKFGFDGFTASNVPAEAAGVVPHSANIEVDAKHIPLLKITESLAGVAGKALEIQNAVPDGNTASPAQKKLEQDAQNLMQSVPQMLTDAGAFLEIKNSGIKATDVQTTLAGKFVAAAATPLKVTGNLKLAFSGLDTAIEGFLAKTKDKQGAAQDRLMGYIQALSAIKMTAKPETGADGKIIHAFSFDLTPDGQMTMNGMPLGALRGLIPGQKAPETKAPMPAENPPAPTP